MPISSNLTQSDLTRQERLMIWLRRAGITKMQIARTLGVQPVAIARWFEAKSIPTWRHNQLVQFGIPAELLPPAVDRAPGPKPKARVCVLSSVQPSCTA